MKPGKIFGRRGISAGRRQQVADRLQRLEIVKTFRMRVDKCFHHAAGVGNLQIARQRQFRGDKRLVELDVLTDLFAVRSFLDSVERFRGVRVTAAQHVILGKFQIGRFAVEEDRLDFIDGDFLGRGVAETRLNSTCVASMPVTRPCSIPLLVLMLSAARPTPPSAKTIAKAKISVRFIVFPFLFFRR